MKRAKKRDVFSILTIERLFLIVGAVFGLVFVFVNPPFHTNDEDRHFLYAYFISEGYLISEQGDNKVGGEISKSLVEVVKSYQGVPFFKGVKISKAKMRESYDVKLNSKGKEFVHNWSYRDNPIPFLPSAIGIAAGKIINSNPVYLGWFGRIGSLLCYLVIIFFAIRTTPVFKTVFFLYGLTPMVLYQGASVTYDMLSNGLSFLLIALFLKYALDASARLRTKDFLIIIFICIVHRYTKDGYFLIPFVFFIIPPKKIGSPLKIILMAAFFVALYYLPNWTWSKIVSQFYLDSTPMLKKDFHLNSGVNLSMNLADPAMFISNLFANINHFRQEWVGGTIGRFGYSYTILPNFFLCIHGLVLLTFALLDSRSDIALRIWRKAIIFIAGFGTIAIIIVGFYVLSPVGAKMIFGLQGRYFIPAIPLLLLLLYNNKFEMKGWSRWNGLAAALYSIAALTYAAVYLDGAMYVP